MNARHFPREGVDYPKPLRSSPGCLAQMVEVLSHLSKSSFPAFLLLCPRRHTGHLVGRGQAAVEAGTSRARGVIRALIGFRRTAAGPVWFWTSDSCSRTVLHCRRWLWLLPACHQIPASLHLPQSSAGPRVNSAFSYPSSGVHRNIGGSRYQTEATFYCSDFPILTALSAPTARPGTLLGCLHVDPLHPTAHPGHVGMSPWGPSAPTARPGHVGMPSRRTSVPTARPGAMLGCFHTDPLLKLYSSSTHCDMNAASFHKVLRIFHFI